MESTFMARRAGEQEHSNWLTAFACVKIRESDVQGKEASWRLKRSPLTIC